jgi:hypothetical protein
MVCEFCDSVFSWMTAERVVPGEVSEADKVDGYDEDSNEADDEVDDYGFSMSLK